MRAILKHWLAASAAGRAAPIISRSVNTSSRTRASIADLSVDPDSGPAMTASKTRRACGWSDAAHILAAALSAYAPCADKRQSNAVHAIVCFIWGSRRRVKRLRRARRSARRRSISRPREAHQGNVVKQGARTRFWASRVRTKPERRRGRTPALGRKARKRAKSRPLNLIGS